MPLTWSQCRSFPRTPKPEHQHRVDPALQAAGDVLDHVGSQRLLVGFVEAQVRDWQIRRLVRIVEAQPQPPAVVDLQRQPPLRDEDPERG